jgi:hypothetical protein
MTDVSGKILVELDYTILEGKDNVSVFLTHPNLRNSLNFSCSSLRLASLQLDDLNFNKEEQFDPLQKVILSANKLTEGISQLKETFLKK